MDANIRFTAVLAKAGLDRYGTWQIVLEVPQSEGEAVLALSKHTEKSLAVDIKPPTIEGVFGKVVE